MAVAVGTKRPTGIATANEQTTKADQCNESDWDEGPRRLENLHCRLSDGGWDRTHASVAARRVLSVFSLFWKVLKDTVLSFIEDEALSRGAAIAFYTVTSVAPLLLIVIAIAGLAFGREAAQNAIVSQLSGLMGQQTAQILETAVASASSKSSGILATLIGVITLIVTASGVFGEIQSALNAIWKAKPEGTSVSRLIRARAASLGLVATLGFLLLVSLVFSAALTAFGNYLNSVLPFGELILSLLNTVVSLVLISVLFAAIYKILPDRRLEWRDVGGGAVVTAVL